MEHKYTTLHVAKHSRSTREHGRTAHDAGNVDELRDDHHVEKRRHAILREDGVARDEVQVDDQHAVQRTRELQ